MPRRIHVGVRAKPETGPRLQEFSVGLPAPEVLPSHASSSSKAVPSGRGLVRLEVGVGGSRSEFHFDNFFDESCSQAHVFDTSARPLIDEVLQGYNGTLFAYGQTGAGKTYTVSGPLGSSVTATATSGDSRGVCDRTILYMFQASAGISSLDESIAIRMSVIEIYNDMVHDLLRPLGTTSKPDYGIVPIAPHKLTIIDSPQGVVVPDLCIVPLASPEEGLVKVSEALGNRSIAEHQLNRQSSRSHCIFTFYVTRTRSAASEGRSASVEALQSKLHLVDLAGSERIEKSGSTGGLAKEATYINRSLTFLEQVVIALTQSGREHIPYRQSKLTYLLKVCMLVYIFGC
jgi:kinesin family protein 6/9